MKTQRGREGGVDKPHENVVDVQNSPAQKTFTKHKFCMKLHVTLV